MYAGHCDLFRLRWFAFVCDDEKDEFKGDKLRFWAGELISTSVLTLRYIVESRRSFSVCLLYCLSGANLSSLILNNAPAELST